MVKLETLRENTMLAPQNYIGISTKSISAISYEKNKCLSMDETFSMNSYIDKFNPEIIEEGSMYSV